MDLAVECRNFAFKLFAKERSKIKGYHSAWLFVDWKLQTIPCLLLLKTCAQNISGKSKVPFNIFPQAGGFPQLNGKKKRLGMFDIYWRVSKFNQDKRWFLCKKNYFGNYHEARATSKKLKKSQKQKMLLFSPRAFLMLSNGWFPLLSQIKRYDCLFCWYWSIIIDNNSDSACALNRLCLNAMGILHPKIKLTMNLYA